jgi:hypothetical protein
MTCPESQRPTAVVLVMARTPNRHFGTQKHNSLALPFFRSRQKVMVGRATKATAGGKEAIVKHKCPFDLHLARWAGNPVRAADALQKPSGPNSAALGRAEGSSQVSDAPTKPQPLSPSCPRSVQQWRARQQRDRTDFKMRFLLKRAF